MTANPRCDGGHCREAEGPVRVYPLGGDATAHFCLTCWGHENRERFERGCQCGHRWELHQRQKNGAYGCHSFGCGCRDLAELGINAEWPQQNWFAAKEVTG